MKRSESMVNSRDICVLCRNRKVIPAQPLLLISVLHVVVVSCFFHPKSIRVNNPATISYIIQIRRVLLTHTQAHPHTHSSQHSVFCIYVSFYLPKNRRTQRYQPKTIQKFRSRDSQRLMIIISSPILWPVFITFCLCVLFSLSPLSVSRFQ